MKNEDEEMPESEMNALLLAFSETRQYQAFMKYVLRRKDLVTDALRSLDPFRNPTEMARNQGIGVGLVDLDEYIKLLKAKNAKIEGKSTKK